MTQNLIYDSLHIDVKSDEPLHIQLKSQLLRSIRMLPPRSGFRLPSERDMAQNLKISRPTIHRTYAELLSQNLVFRQPDKSLTVADDIRQRLAGSYHVLAVLLPMDFTEFTNAYHDSALHYLLGILGRCSSRNISCLMLQAPAPDSSPAELDEFIETHFHRLQGLIHIGQLYDNHQEHILEKLMNYSPLPQVCISGLSSLPHISSVYTNPAPGLTSLARTLQARGYRRAATIELKSSPQSSLFRYTSSDRCLEARRILERHGLACRQSVIIQSEAEAEPILALLRSPRRPEIIFCQNDRIARNVMKLAHACGLEIPDDLGIAGYDRNTADPGLATIDGFPRKVAETAVDLLLKQFNHGFTPGSRIRTIPSEFHDGGSIRPAS